MNLLNYSIIWAGGSEAQGNSETTPQATEIIQQAVNAVASNLRLHQDTSNAYTLAYSYEFIYYIHI